MSMTLDALSVLFRAEPQTVLSLLVAVGSLLVYRRFKDAPTILLLVGSIAQFIVFAGSAFTSHAVTQEWISPASSFWPCWNFVHWVAAVATLCFPLGFLWYALRIRRNI
jgi:hypothetical protein